jgi:hypothetical protein
MGLILLTLAGAVGVAKLAGGRLGALDRVPVRGWPLLAGTLAGLWLGAGAAVAGLPAAVRWLALAAAITCALAYCVANRAVPGTGLVGTGLLLNALVIVLNGGMPVSADAAVRAGVTAADAVADPRHVPTGPGTALAALGDVVPVPLPLRPEVVSAGDLLVAAGLAQLLATAMLAGAAAPRPGPRPRPAPHRGPRPTAHTARHAAAERSPAAPAPEPSTDLPEGIVRIFRPGEYHP